jgi:hypothetical protein
MFNNIFGNNNKIISSLTKEKAIFEKVVIDDIPFYVLHPDKNIEIIIEPTFDGFAVKYSYDFDVVESYKFKTAEDAFKKAIEIYLNLKSK